MPGFDMTFVRTLFFVFLFAFALPVSTATAHNLNVFAMSNGDTIEGYVYFSGGTRARQALIELHGTDDRILFTTKTDDQGSFAFTVSHRANYTVFTNTGDGHVASFALRTDEFAEHLPIAGSETDVTVTQVSRTGPDSTVETDATATEPQSSYISKNDLQALSHDELSTLINHAVARQIGPLREEVNAYRNDVRLSDILGGIGMIMGIFGVCAWLMARRQTGK
ncbi:hypothetical protein UF64_12765 [Thalassospira sp. HJ]|nr:hypothetical protein UF64_12765 [Thalassospira sp. HJ]